MRLILAFRSIPVFWTHIWICKCWVRLWGQFCRLRGGVCWEFFFGVLVKIIKFLLEYGSIFIEARLAQWNFLSIAGERLWRLNSEVIMEAFYCEIQHCSEPDTLREVSCLRIVKNITATKVYHAYWSFRFELTSWKPNGARSSCRCDRAALFGLYIEVTVPRKAIRHLQLYPQTSFLSKWRINFCSNLNGGLAVGSVILQTTGPTNSWYTAYYKFWLLTTCLFPDHFTGRPQCHLKVIIDRLRGLSVGTWWGKKWSGETHCPKSKRKAC